MSADETVFQYPPEFGLYLDLTSPSFQTTSQGNEDSVNDTGKNCKD